MRSASASRWAGRSGCRSPRWPRSARRSGRGAARRPAPPRSRQRGERGVAVVGAAAAVEPVALDDRRPRPEPVAPADHLGLLVEVAVEQHGVGRRSPPPKAGTSMTISGVRPASSLTLDGHAGDRPRRAPRRGPARRRAPCGRARPSAASKAARHVGDADVVVQRRQDDRTRRAVPSVLRDVIARSAARAIRRCARSARPTAATTIGRRASASATMRGRGRRPGSSSSMAPTP